MEKIYLECLLREETGKTKLGIVRREGFIPAVVYGQGAKTLSIKINRSQLVKFMHAHHGAENMIITLKLAEGAKSKEFGAEKPVLIKDIQYHPVDDHILHVDFNQISLSKAIVVKVPVHSKGEAIGAKQDGGILTHVMWELEVECLPTQIPEKIEVEVSHLKIGDAIQVKDLTVPEGIKILADKDAMVLTVVPPKKVEEAAPAAEAVAAAPTEPEVIKKEKKEKEEEAGAEAEAAPKAAPKAPEKK